MRSESNEFKKTKVLLTPFFAPYKVVLLALIAAYCAGILPKATHRPLLSVIVQYIEGPSTQGNDTEGDNETKSISVPTLQDILSTLRIACLKADQTEGGKYANDIEMRVLHALWNLKSVDSLHSFIMRSRALLVDNLKQGREMLDNSSSIEIPKYILTQNSFLGRFVVNCIVSFESFEFDKTLLLWESFVSFRASSKVQWQLKTGRDSFGSGNPDDDPSAIMRVLEQIELDDESIEDQDEILMLSQEDVSKLIDYQVHILETYGTPTHPEFRTILGKMTQYETAKLPSTHYIRYLECLRDADYEGAFNALHRYFDYMMSNRKTVFYQYALLSLATLYAAFNCDGEAIRAIEESISVARENKDIDCLNFLLTWLFNFLKDRPNLKHEFFVSNDQLLQFLKSKAANPERSGFTGIHSTAYQSDATQSMLEGQPVSTILESLTKAMYIALNSVHTNNLTAFISFTELNSAFWLRSGQQDLAEVYNTIALESSTSVGQRVSVMIRQASLLFLNGEVEKSLMTLQEQDSLIRGDLRLKKQLVCHECLFRAEHLIRSSNYQGAGIYLAKLKSQEGEYGSIDIQGQLYYLTAYLEFQMGNMDRAFDVISKVLDSEFAQISKNAYWFIRFTLLNCQLMISQGNSSGVRVLTQVIQCFKVAKRGGFELLMLQSILSLIDILNYLKQFDDSMLLIDEFLSKVVKCPDLELKSRFMQVSALVMIERYDSLTADEAHVNRILKTLEVAIDSFKKISSFKEVKRTLCLQQRFGSLLQNPDLTMHSEELITQFNQLLEKQVTALR